MPKSLHLSSLTRKETAAMANSTPTNLRHSPAEHLTEAMAAATVTGERGVAVRELAFRPQTGIRALAGSKSAAALEDHLGFSFPAAGSTSGDLEALHLIWLSPDEYLLVDVSAEQTFGHEAPLVEALGDLPGQVVDLSGNRTIFELTGPSARAVLEKGCHLDLHPREFAVGDSAATLLGPVQVILYRSGEESWRILPRSSFADYMGLWLMDGMREFAHEQVA